MLHLQVQYLVQNRIGFSEVSKFQDNITQCDKEVLLAGFYNNIDGILGKPLVQSSFNILWLHSRLVFLSDYTVCVIQHSMLVGFVCLTG